MSLAAETIISRERWLISAELLPQHAHLQRVARRVVDVVGAALGLAVGIAPAVVIAGAIKLTSRGPSLFVQERVGLGGEPFHIFKFRTMRDGTHEEILRDARLAADYRANDFKLQPDDPRITPLGRWLRKTSIDELPQLLNVMRGEMSLVGVRPLLREELALRPAYDQALYRMMRPGLTGSWQVQGRSTVARTNRRELDRRYVEDWTLLEDLRILARTPAAVFRTSNTH